MYWARLSDCQTRVAQAGAEPDRRGTRGQSRAVSVDHYENFPVASLLCPPALRPAVAAIYRLRPHRRRHRRRRRRAGRRSAWPTSTPTGPTCAPSAAGNAAVGALAAGVRAAGDRRCARIDCRCRCWTTCSSAFAQDVVQDALRRPRRTARLLPPLGQPGRPAAAAPVRRARRATSLRQSDAICSALQLINFWQDLSVDVPRGRLYLPLADCAAARRATPDAAARSDEPRRPRAR